VVAPQVAFFPAMAMQSVFTQQPVGSIQAVPHGLVVASQLYEQVLEPVSQRPTLPFCGGQSPSVQQPETQRLPHFF